MNINRLQLRRLEYAITNKGKSVSILKTFLSGWKFYCVFFLILGTGSIIFWKLHEQIMSAIFIGIMLGVLWRDLIYFRLNQRFKAISDKITNWEEVEKIINEQKKT